jgi:hypothetical protein
LLKIINFLSSRRLAIILILLISGAALVGALVPQRLGDEYYKEHYDAWAYNALKLLGINNIQRSWFFLAILGSFAVNLAFCAARRFSALLAAFLPREPRFPINDREYQTADVGGGGDFERVTARLRTLRFKWRERGGVLFGRRRPLALAGPLFIHLGLLLALLAFFLGVFSRRGEIFVFEGQGVVLGPAYGKNLEVRADDVEEMADANTGRVITRRTKVRLLHYGVPLAAAELEVNRPLRYGGFSIYQSGMAPAGAKGLLIEEVELKKGAAAGEYGRANFSWVVGGKTGEMTLAPGETRPLGDTGFTLRYVDYVEALNATEDGIRDGGADYNPAAFVQLVNAAGDTAEGVLFKLYPERSFMRTGVSEFEEKGVRVDYGGDEGPWRVARRELLVASGARLAGAGGEGTMEVVMGPGEGPDLRGRYLDCVIDNVGGKERIKLPFGERVSVMTNEGTYIYRFMGSRMAPVSALTVVRDPGLAAFYAACLIFSLGLVVAALWRYDELAAYVHEGRVYLAARSSGGARELKPLFDSWVAAAEGKPKNDDV